MRSDVRDFFDALAPNWDAYAKDDLSYVASLLSRIPSPKGGRVLDLACGTGVISGLLHEWSHGVVHGLDIAPNMIAIAKGKYAGFDGISFETADFLEWDGDRYDAIILYNAYPHFVDVSAFIEALKRHLKPSGRFAIIHSIGRAQLHHHHEGLAATISRNLLPVEEEGERYRHDFALDVVDEGDHFYLLSGTFR